MSLRLSSACSLLVVAATFIALEPAAHAQQKAGTGGAKPAAPAPTPAPTPAPAPAVTAPFEPAPAADADHPAKRAIYLFGEIGFTRQDLGGISNNLGFDKTKANGIVAGLGMGYRFKALHIGARFRDSSTTEFSLWSVMGEVGYALPFRPLTPVIFIHAGYMFEAGVERAVIASSLPPGNVLTPTVHLDGLVLGAEAYFAYSVSDFFKVGPFLGLDLTFLHRAQVGLPQSVFTLPAETRNNALFSDSGSGVGYAFNLGVRVTGDIGF